MDQKYLKAAQKTLTLILNYQNTDGSFDAECAFVNCMPEFLGNDKLQPLRQAEKSSRQTYSSARLEYALTQNWLLKPGFRLANPKESEPMHAWKPT
jgi:hypothetical protein